MFAMKCTPQVSENCNHTLKH